ncbi:MAG: hypothetical protein GY794_19490 [bacterium]|nr:hypothetical protein [bacterium]
MQAVHYTTSNAENALALADDLCTLRSAKNKKNKKNNNNKEGENRAPP